MKKPKNRQEAEATGFIVDVHVYPWIAYKGPRFEPTEQHNIDTDLEADLRGALVIAARKLVEAKR